ncbi:glutathione S-transferase family protein [Catenovulum sp. SM1970]|uniref:glutathione S-transferase family protein n=1 Tax=Marinifaba aquimaris TaxID=2741323 RepID=UPI0015719A7E|nr:glutathione S-transferase family protein [Marinifaba aquimaris]NTS76271.1 glutathione S-transferase family protein [Marinifaba aquimaris]
MYQLYYYPNNASLSPHLVLQEIGVPFDLLLVDRQSNAQKSAEYLKLNPAGRIPTLIDDGQAIFESPAICMHLADKHLDAGLAPALGSTERALYYQWMTYLTNTVQAELMIYYYTSRHVPLDTDFGKVKQIHEQRIGEMLALLDRELATRPYIAGEQLTACDYFLFMLAIWSDEFAKPPLSYEHLGAYLRKLAKRDAVIAVCEKEEISLALYQ